MKGFSQEDFDAYVLRNKVLGFQASPITLKSGRKSHFYANWRDIVEDTFRTFEELTPFVIAFAQQHGLTPDTFYGVPEGATKLGLMTQLRWAQMSSSYAPGSHVLSMGRAKAKEHGQPKDKFFLGKPQGKTVVIEDVTTTGGSLIETIRQLKEAEVEVLAALGLTNRNEKRDDGKTVEQALRELGVPYFALSNAVDLLPKAFQLQEPGYRVGREVERYFSQYGTQALDLLQRIQLTSAEQFARSKLCLPLDGLDTLEALEERVAELDQVVGMFKVGLESYVGFGPAAIQAVQRYGGKVFLDLKLHDIPKTVENAAYQAAKQGVSMLTVHALGGVEMMEAAVEGARRGAEEKGYEKPKVLGVTILTSTDQNRMNQQMGISGTVEENVLKLARRASEAGVDGIVCSAADLPAVRPYLSDGFMYVTPGIQGPDGAVGGDQARTSTPGNALRNGSSLLVVGRPINNNPNAERRIEAAYNILKDMAS
ncbi:orotidine-5'-phosphate decarboxylase [Candidatus Woesearchaeota archaeon]|nr:orotidine-5'-phosphate decarboxylase [Candidatus Woesearchaeota archaeon]